jgi:hypothetical protein
MYGYVYPFIELVLGASYLSKYSILISAAGTNVATIVLMTLTTVGVLDVLRFPGAKPLQCACLGAGLGLQLPMTQVTLLENISMIAMSVFMLIRGIH